MPKVYHIAIDLTHQGHQGIEKTMQLLRSKLFLRENSLLHTMPSSRKCQTSTINENYTNAR